jgi:hypothetical protein
VALKIRRTHALGALAVGLTVAVVALEYAHVWRRGRAPLPTETDDVLEAGREAALETVEVAVAGYRTGTKRENALLNLLLSFALTFGLVRASTHSIRARGRFGPIRNILVGDRHIHHFIPGIGLAFLSGGAAIVMRGDRFDRWLALPFGVGMALTLDEAALLIEFEDVYWTEEGVLSVQVTLAAMALLGALALSLRLLRRGEAEVLASDAPPSAVADRVAPT